jgi:exosortase F-associated protein
MKKNLLIATALIGLILIFLFQKVSYAGLWNLFAPQAFSIENVNVVFIFNKTLRLILNDALCMLLIWSFFENRSYFRVAFLLFLTELVLVLPIYFFFKLRLEGPSELSSPLLSQIHRMVVNPLLMFLLILGFMYQQSITEIKS